MNQRRPSLFRSPSLDGLALALISSALSVFSLWMVVFPQGIARKPAAEGVLSLHLGQRGDLRLWNQPIRPQDLPALLEKAKAKHSSDLTIRLIPEHQVPWGVVNVMLTRLQPDTPQSWTLQLQLP